MPDDPQAAVQDPEITAASDAATASAPLEPTAGSDPVADAAKIERDRRAKEGREKAALERRASTAEQLAAAQALELREMRQQVAEIKQFQTAQQQAEQEARLAALPPDQRNAAELQMIKAQLAQRDNVQYQQTRMQELATQANQAFGLNGDLGIRPDDPLLDTTSEATYIASLKTLGAVRRQTGAANRPTDAETEEGNPMPKSKGEPTVQEQIDAGIEEGLQKIRQEMGIGRSNSPRAAGSAGSADAESIQSDVQGALRNYSPRNPGATRAALKAAAEAARTLAPGGRR